MDSSIILRAQRLYSASILSISMHLISSFATDKITNLKHRFSLVGEVYRKSLYIYIQCLSGKAFEIDAIAVCTDTNKSIVMHKQYFRHIHPTIPYCTEFLIHECIISYTHTYFLFVFLFFYFFILGWQTYCSRNSSVQCLCINLILQAFHPPSFPLVFPSFPYLSCCSSIAIANLLHSKIKREWGCVFLCINIHSGKCIKWRQTSNPCDCYCYREHYSPLKFQCE